MIPSLGTAALFIAAVACAGCSFGNSSAPSSREAVTQYFNKVGAAPSFQKGRGRATRATVAKVKSIKGRVFKAGGTPE
jgi:hypothetical protein